MATFTLELKALVPTLMREAIKVARQKCERFRVGSCIVTTRNKKRWCTPCTLRHAAMKDLAKSQATSAIDESMKRTARRG